MLPRLTRRAFRDLAIWMIGLGVLVGTVFPFLVPFLGVPHEQAFSPPFILAALAAGVAVGSINFALAHLVFGSRLRVLSTRMRFVEDTVREMTFVGNWDSFNAKSIPRMKSARAPGPSIS